MKKIKIENFEYLLKRNEKIVGLVTESKNQYSIILKPKKEEE